MSTIKIITIVSYKGGTGKTTTAKNMATILAQKYDAKVLCIDLDASGNLSSYFGCKKEDNQPCGLYRLLAEESTSASDVIVHTNYENIDLIDSNDMISKADMAMKLDFVSQQQFHLRDKLQSIQDQYDYVIMDSPPTENLVVINAMAASRELIIPCNVEQDSYDGVFRVTRALSLVRQYNPALTIRGVLLTQIQRNGTDKQAIEMGVANLPKFNTYIRHSVQVKNSNFNRVALAVQDKNCKPAKDYDNFVAEYLGLPAVHPEAQYVKKKMFNLGTH